MKPEQDQGCTGRRKASWQETRRQPRDHPDARMRKRSAATRRERAAARAADLAPTIAALQAAGATTLRAIAAGLNEQGIPTARGDGEWAVALRCAEMQGRIALLFAGAGIVADSDPEAELAETDAKFRSMLEALGYA